VLPNWAATQNNYSAETLSNTTKNNYELASAHFQQTLFVEELVEFSFRAQEFHEHETFTPFGKLAFQDIQIVAENIFGKTKNLQQEDLKKRILQHIFPFHFFF